jgi:hypothetical protein
MKKGGIMLRILYDIVDVGFKDYEDFKDQIDAVDLGLIDSPTAELQESLSELFQNLRKD